MQIKLISGLRCLSAWTLVVVSLWAGAGSSFAQPAAPPLLKPGSPIASVAAMASSPDALVWDSKFKEVTPAEGARKADFIFAFTNVTSSNVVIRDAHGSCSCTVAKLPSVPWVLLPHTNGQLNVTVDLAGKYGVLNKTVTITYTNGAQTVLAVKVNLPPDPRLMRGNNMMLASADKQAVFKREDCAKCHAEPTHGKMGKELYVAACGICHDSPQRASMVPDLHTLKQPTSYDYWKMMIANGNGKTNSLMPQFSVSHGGPLTDKQIESLAQVLVKAFPTTPPQHASAGDRRNFVVPQATLGPAINN